MSKNSRIVYKNQDGEWVNKRSDANKAASLHRTQIAAETAARSMLRSSGGGELITKGANGRIRSKDTIAPGRDPNPPKDREHLTDSNDPMRTFSWGRCRVGGLIPGEDMLCTLQLLR